jgi:hypothetical protein
MSSPASFDTTTYFRRLGVPGSGAPDSTGAAGSRTLSLVEAFRGLGPLTGNPALDEVRSAAATCIFDEIRRIAGRGRCDHHLRDEAVSLVLLRLVQRSHRKRSPGRTPSSESDVCAYLGGALRNNLRELRRGARGANLAVFDAALAGAGDAAEPADAIDRERARGELEDARRRLFDTVVPAVAARRRVRAREAFLATVADLRAISEGRKSVSDVVSATLEGAKHGHDAPEWRRARNNVDQRFSRALRDLVAEARSLRERGSIDERRYRALRVSIDTIRPGGESESSG